MNRLLAAVAALLPAATLAQGALDAARGAAKTSDQGNERIERAADAQLAAGESAPAAATAMPTMETTVVESVPPGQPLPDGALDVGVEGSAQAGGRGAVPPPDTYTIRPGDTLWDLSGRFLNNPWYWPKIWSYNPDIANPHWIYPGNLLRFYPSSEEAPARVEPVPAVAAGEPQDFEEEELATPRELEDLSRADLKEPPSAEEQEAVAVSGPYKIGHVSGRATMARRDSFVTPRELAESGEITAAFEEKSMLATLDKAYARFADKAAVKTGETYVVYRTSGDVKHPVTGELLGYQTIVLGAARVVAVDDKAASLVIVQANDVIERGAMLGPWTDKFFRRVNPTPNGQALQGLIVGSQTRIVTQFGEQQVVYVDRGEKDGVREGNVFTVVRSGDLYGKPPDRPEWDESLPKEDIGQLLVVDVKERASTALVTKSVKELYIGDRVELRPAEGIAQQPN